VARQLYDAWGNTRPSGVSGGSMPTDIGYTGQRGNLNIGLLFYNARFYSPVLGRFISADNIAADPKNSQYLNRYSYVLNQPLRFTDPTGECPKGDKACEKIVADIETQFGIKLVDGTAVWLVDTAQSIFDGLQEILSQFQTINANATEADIKALFGGTTFYRDKASSLGLRYAESIAGNVRFFDLWAGESSVSRQFYMAHEMGHLWDSRYQLFHWFYNDKSQDFAGKVGAEGYNCVLGLCTYNPGADLPRTNVDHRRDSACEDWADSFASAMIPAMGRTIGANRTQYVEDKVNEWVNSKFRP
jgi:RHS repeat-associated protein